MTSRELDDGAPVLLAQGVYYLGTGVAPFLSRRVFEALTGRKRDWWLVETVGGVVAVAGGTLLSAVRGDRVTPETVALAAGCAATLAAVDVVYVARRRIAPTYLLDAAAQLALLGALGRRLRAAGPARRPAR
jgi:hypothetical protein